MLLLFNILLKNIDNTTVNITVTIIPVGALILKRTVILVKLMDADWTLSRNSRTLEKIDHATVSLQNQKNQCKLKKTLNFCNYYSVSYDSEA